MDEEARGEAERDVATEFAPVDEARVGPLGKEQEARLDAVELRHRRERRAEAAEDLGSKRVIQRRFNVSVPRARVPEKASTLRERSER